MRGLKSSAGFSLASVLVGVGVISVVALGIAATVTGGIDGMSHMRNVALAEDISGLVSGMLGDPDYCALHFKGKKISGALPSVIDKDVVFKDVTPAGTLGSNEIIKAGKKYQNVLQVESITLSADNSLGANRYLGSVKFNLKGNTGYNLYFNRSIPLQIATDTSGNITACSRASEVVHGSQQGVWSDNCNDFAAKGWPSKDACLKDGRWHLAYSHNASGTPTLGNINTLIGYIEEGAEVKVRLPAGGFAPGIDGFYESCVSTIRNAGKLACLSSSRQAVPDWNTPVIKEVGGVVYFSNGMLVYKEPSDMVRVPMQWYVKF
jgi:hypothetical protein